MTLLSRDSNTVIDEYGIDPLQDAGLNAIHRVTNYTTYTVTARESGRPELLSHLFYNTVDLWWAVLAYNGITDVRELVEGMVLKVPSYNEIISELSKPVMANNSSSSVTI
jgi:hypothetical protein